MGIVVPLLGAIVVVAVLERLWAYLRKRRAVNIVLVIGEDKTAAFDSGTGLLAEWHNTIALGNSNGARKLLACGQSRESIVNVHPDWRVIHLVKDAQHLDEQQLESHWTTLLAFCCEEAKKLGRRTFGFLDVKMSPHTGSARIDSVLTRIVQEQKLRVVGELSLQEEVPPIPARGV